MLFVDVLLQASYMYDQEHTSQHLQLTYKINSHQINKMLCGSYYQLGHLLYSVGGNIFEGLKTINTLSFSRTIIGN